MKWTSRSSVRAPWVQLADDGQTIKQARIALGAVAPTPQLAAEASQWLAGKPATEDIFARAGEIARNVAAPITDMRGTAEYRMHLIGVLVKRTLLKATRARRPIALILPGTSYTSSFRLLKPMSKKLHITTTVNGEPAEFLCEPRQSLLEVLRDTLRLTGTKEGCNNGNCGACTVLMNGLPVNSCVVLAAEAEGAKIETVESLAQHGHLHPLQQCFLEGAALQCGICTPGFLVAAKSAPRQKPQPQRTRDSLPTSRQPVPLHRLRQNRPGSASGSKGIGGDSLDIIKVCAYVLCRGK